MKNRLYISHWRDGVFSLAAPRVFKLIVYTGVTCQNPTASCQRRRSWRSAARMRLRSVCGAFRCSALRFQHFGNCWNSESVIWSIRTAATMGWVLIDLVSVTEISSRGWKTKANVEIWFGSFNGVHLVLGGELPPVSASRGVSLFDEWNAILKRLDLMFLNLFWYFQAGHLFSNYIPKKIAQLDALLKVSSFFV